ncbi:MAG: hypothetical protein LBP98_09205, partial [Tannerella sp.]|nr:hypothetical protein [Tannerella sp.]
SIQLDSVPFYAVYGRYGCFASVGADCVGIVVCLGDRSFELREQAWLDGAFKQVFEGLIKENVL